MENQIKSVRKSVGFYLFREKIGRGSYSEVYRGYDIRTFKQVALKVIDHDKINKNQLVRRGLESQIKALNLLRDNAHVIKLLDNFKTRKQQILVYQYCNQGNLDQMIKRNKFLPESQAMEYFRQIVLGYKNLLSFNIVHRDMKPQNILIKDGTVKIADFGLCHILQQPKEYMSAMVGTLRYQAPEIIRGNWYNSKCDIYSLGVILYKMLFGKCPFLFDCPIETVHSLINLHLEFPSDIKVSKRTLELLKKMLQKQQQNRASWKQIFEYYNTKQMSSIQENACLQKRQSSNETRGESEATETTTSSISISERKKIQKVQYAMLMHEQVININDIVMECFKHFESSSATIIAKVCINRISNQFKSLLKEIKGKLYMHDVYQILKENYRVFLELSSMCSIFYIKSKKNQAATLQQGFKSLMRDFVMSAKMLKDRKAKLLAVRLIDIERQRILLSKQAYQLMSDREIGSRLHNYS